MATDISGNPTIKPVLDLSAIRKDSSLISGMLTPPTLAVDGTYAKAATLAVSARANEESVPETKGTATPEAGTKLTFIQNNNSPKALSNAEIYRQTNNQMSQLKEGLRKK